MKKINIRRIIYHIKHRYFTLNNAVLLVAFIVSANWVWGSLEVMQRNYNLQKALDDKSRQLILAQLDTENAKLEQRYYKTDEYKELAVRERLGLVKPGESVIFLPPNSETIKKTDQELSATVTSDVIEMSNFDQWINFLFGNNSKKLSE